MSHTKQMVIDKLVNKIKKVKSFKDPEKTRKLILYEAF
jgi:hypothetical protein